MRNHPTTSIRLEHRHACDMAMLDGNATVLRHPLPAEAAKPYSCAALVLRAHASNGCSPIS